MQAVSAAQQGVNRDDCHTTVSVFLCQPWCRIDDHSVSGRTIAISGASGKTGYRIAEEILASGDQARLILRPDSIIPQARRIALKMSRCWPNRPGEVLVSRICETRNVANRLPFPPGHA